MTPAELKTAHESLGMSTANLAERMGVSSGRVWVYEAATRTLDVPEHAAAVVLDLLNDREATAEYLADVIADSELGYIPRHRDLAEFERWAPAMRGWGVLAQGMLIADLQRRLQLPVEWV